MTTRHKIRDEDFIISFCTEMPLSRETSTASLVSEISGTIMVVDEDDNRRPAGQLTASLVRFGQVNKDVGTFDLGDCVSSSISDVFGAVFDVETGEMRDVIRDRFDHYGEDVLVIDRVEIRPAFAGRGLGRAAVQRTIELFAPLELVAVKPFPLQWEGASSDRQRAVVKARQYGVKTTTATADQKKVEAVWRSMGFRPVEKGSDIFVLSAEMKRPNVLLR